MKSKVCRDQKSLKTSDILHIRMELLTLRWCVSNKQNIGFQCVLTVLTVSKIKSLRFTIKQWRYMKEVSIGNVFT